MDAVGKLTWVLRSIQPKLSPGSGKVMAAGATLTTSPRGCPLVDKKNGASTINNTPKDMKNGASTINNTPTDKKMELAV